MNTRQHGFTLIEVMVAIMLMAIVSLIAWRGLDSVSRADQHLQASTEHTEALLRALNQLERDLALRASTELRVPNLTQHETEPAQAPPAISVRSADNQRFRLDVIRSAAASEDGLQRVRWWLQDQTLYRAAAPARSRYPLPAPGEGVAVLDKVSDLQVRVWEPGQGWRQLSGNRKDEPQGLEIKLTRQTLQGAEHYRQVVGPLN
ncbi:MULTISPECIES: prepilin-type N-terminal cleavage/methylation domain-containing protein [Pseudomonas fluorescens group]|uniref:Type II secretion system protein J n=2 Tax=Pseudomonas fluorescens TaxID=294 RepID=C3KCW8_PSEFS|nr:MULTISPECIES: prepilin-type N-terminal cleavage/methylation domain-containing protein [Pseudomonas fluorescens group]MBZ6454268.1 prepilin-type N-terminal cleavage/methylation domain-containing protein [Pseudomonas fluorescens group sp.]MBZ6460254.1 prepilin-type N-terminal cleavage/methylation domain-containing protein [Pseudomonas fluorescens group sp.]MBZ6465895.1 prepilin-type N-terminal cleavage/methylation domain-containing protein [Pseudomonas fluorescens group sp.]WPN20785.1 prepilin